MANALRDIVGFGARAADAALLGGAVGKSQRRNKFADMLEGGDYAGAEQLAVRHGEGAYAQLARETGQQKRLDQQTFYLGALRQLRKTPVEQRGVAFQTLAPFAMELGADEEDIQSVMAVLDNDAELDALIGGLGGGAGQRVQSSFTDASGNVRILYNDGRVGDTGVKERNPFQVTDIGGVKYAVDRTTGARIPLADLQETAGNAGQIAGSKAYATEEGKADFAATQALPGAEASLGQILDSIKELAPGGERNKAFRDAFGIRRPDIAVLPGEPRQAAQALVDRIAGKLTLEEASQLKGVLSDRDMELLARAATTLNNRNISDADAERALLDIQQLFEARLETAQSRATRSRYAPQPQQQPQQAPSGALTPDEQAELEQLRRELGVQ